LHAGRHAEALVARAIVSIIAAMTSEDFQDGARFQVIGDVVLHDVVLGGQPLPTVTVYLDKTSRECYQVSTQGNFYRKTAKPSHEHQILKYGEWTPLR